MQPKDRRRAGDRRGNAAPASPTVILATGRRYLYSNIYFVKDETLASLAEQILVHARRLTDAQGLKVRPPFPFTKPDVDDFVRSVARKAIEAMCEIAVEDLEPGHRYPAATNWTDVGAFTSWITPKASS